MTFFYLLKDHPWLKSLAALVIMYLCGLDFTLLALIDPYFLVSAASLLLIALYNGQRGLKLKYFFYGFYPVHLLLLYLIATGLLKTTL